jgi:hypothetical protein
MLVTLFTFRRPIIFDNRQYVDPDESQLIAGAMTLQHDPTFWRSVDGSTLGPVASQEILRHASAGETLGVWDWAPKFWVANREMSLRKRKLAPLRRN